MKKIMFLLVFFVSVYNCFSQVQNDTIDNKYLEDQLYLSLSYNILLNSPEEDLNSPFSLGVSLGFIRDIPFNERRNFGVGIGLGYSYNSYNNSIILLDYAQNNTDNFVSYQTDRITTNLVELPIEIRWRTSTATKYNFWRIYGGFKFAYIFHSKSKLNYNSETITVKNLDPLNKLQYGAILSAGYGTWNLYGYYGLSNLFDSIGSNGKMLDVRDFNIGLKFYIL